MPDKPRILRPRPPEEIQSLLEKVRTKARRSRFQQAVRTRRLSVISINCWGREIYRDLDIPYQTPFVNLYMFLPCFVGFLENFETAIQSPLEFIDKSSYEGEFPYPIGMIMGTYEIHFMHYATREEAREKWCRRRDRMVTDMDDCYFMAMRLGDPYVDELRRFDQLPFRNKVLFVDRPMPEVPNAVVVPPPTGVYDVNDGPTLYWRCQQYFDLPAWLNKEPQPSLSAISS
jgi:uncharacterized protein (DUF1919 family)